MPVLIETLTPPTFAMSGNVKDYSQARRDGNWLPVANVWVQNCNKILFQVRERNSYFEAGKLDVAAGGYLLPGESYLQGAARELQEELGVTANTQDLQYIYKRLSVGVSAKTGLEIKNVVYVYTYKTALNLQDFKIEEQELDGLCYVELAGLRKVFNDTKYSFDVQILNLNGNLITTSVTQDSFVYNFDSYYPYMVQKLMA